MPQAPRVNELTIPLRIVVTSPPSGILFCVQGKLGEYLAPVRSTGADMVFDVSARARIEPDGVRLLGNVVQGPPAARFLYVCSGTCAGDVGTPWTRRAKIPLGGITPALAKLACESGRLEARIAGRAKDSGPACGTVPLLGAGWRHVT
jgi:hypothetical protein